MNNLVRRLSILMIYLMSVSIVLPQHQRNHDKVNPDYANVNYAGDSLKAHELDIYIPKDGKDKHKIVIIIYGSAWFANDRKEYAYHSIGKPLTDAGFAVASINHRSSGDAKYPAQINDVKGAIRFLRANADKYGLDTSFIGITGFSSGGHLSAMAGVTNGMKKRKIGKTTIDIEGPIGGNLDQSSDVNAVFDWFGPVDMSRMQDCSTVKDARSPEAALIGGAPSENMDMVKLISPISYVSKKTVPFIVVHGTADDVVPYCQGEFFSDKLKKAGKLEKFISVPDGKHGPVTFNDETFKAMTDFFISQSEK